MVSVLPRSFEAVRFTKGRPVILKSGRPSIQTVKHHWCPCSVCGVGTWVLAKDLKRPRGHPEAIPGRPCRMTPHCEGQHRKQTEEES
jgi:hypothetical protein